MKKQMLNGQVSKLQNLDKKSLQIKKQTNKGQTSFISKFNIMNFIKSASSTPQEQKLEKLQEQKFISILEQNEIRYLNINENKYLIQFLSNSPLIKDIPNKHDIIKTLISKTKYIKLDQGQALPNQKSSTGSNVVTLIIAGCLENTNIKTQRNNNENANVQSVFTDKLNQQMNFSSVYKLMESTESSFQCDNEISDIIPFIQTFKKQILNNNFMKCQQNKQFVFSLDKPFAYNDKLNDQDKGDNPLVASKVSFIFQIELQEFLALFEQFLSQIVVITNLLRKIPLSKQLSSTLAPKFKQQLYYNKKNIDLENNILIVKHGQIVLYNEGLIVRTYSEQQIINLDNQQQKKDYDSCSISNPLIAYSLNKKQFEYYNKLFISQNLNKSEKRCISSLSNSLIIQDSKQILKNNSPFNIRNSTTYQFDQRNVQLCDQTQNTNNKNQKISMKRNSLVLESSSCLYPTIQENSSFIIPFKKNNNSNQRHNLSNSQIRTSLVDLNDVNINQQNKNIINQLINDERYHNQHLSHLQQNSYRLPVDKLTSIKKQLNTNITKCYNFISSSKKQNYCVKDIFIQEKVCKTSRCNSQLSFDNNSNNNNSSQNYLKESNFQQNQCLYQSKQASQQELIQKSNQGNFSFHDQSSKLESIKLGSQTERGILDTDNYQRQQQQKTVTVASFKSKNKPKYYSEKKQNKKLEDAMMNINHNNDNYNFILNEQKRSSTTMQRQLKKQELDTNQANDTFYIEQDPQSKSIFDSTKDSKRKSDSLNDSYSTQQTVFQTDTDDITLKQKYDLENFSSQYESSIKQNSQCKTCGLRQLKCKKKINQYHEIQQQIQWDHLKSKYIQDIINQKQQDDQENQQMNSSNTKKEQKQFELNILQYVYQNQQQDLSPIQNSNPIQFNQQQMYEDRLFSSDYLDTRQQKPMHTVYLNDSYIDNYKKQITKNLQENLQKQVIKNQRNQEIQNKTNSNAFNFAKSQKINDKLGIIVQNKSQANVQKHFNILNKLLVRNLENANSSLKYAKKRNFSQNTNNKFQQQKNDDNFTKNKYLFNQTSFDFRQNY
ncbi:hypothetical protein ABPG72_015014 [Tetrahymena utriculariae]